VPEHVEGSEDANKNAIFNAKFEHDGYVDHSTWIHKSEETQVSVTQKRIRRTARQDQMKHADFAEVASNDDIAAFISDLRHTVLKFQVGKKKELSHTEMASAQESILSGAALLCEDDYSNALEEWKLSSSPLSSHKKGNVFLHSYAKAVRNQGIDANLKTLVKEARKCRKRLPLPSTNSAIYVCFAEERMDLCRVVISGPIDTPYQLSSKLSSDTTPCYFYDNRYVNTVACKNKWQRDRRTPPLSSKQEVDVSASTLTCMWMTKSVSLS
jgi:hypothetical protein